MIGRARRDELARVAAATGWSIPQLRAHTLGDYQAVQRLLLERTRRKAMAKARGRG